MGMMGIDGGRGLLSQEQAKPRALGQTLARMGGYFRRAWVGLVVAVVAVLIGSAAQVISPVFIGQATDCYLVPSDTCWFDANAGAGQPVGARVAGLGVLALWLVGLYLVNAVLTGVGFHAMRVSGSNVIRQMQQDLFRQIQRLSAGYYSRNEAGDVMSRVTNDVETLQQVFGFALLNVMSGVLTMVFAVIVMLVSHWSYALVSLAVTPVMLILTVVFSNQARRAYREARKELGAVNADLQESLSGAREVQAFSREDETIAQFEVSNQANRGALTPVLEALGYVALAIVVLYGGLAVVNNGAVFGNVNAATLGGLITAGTVLAFINYVQILNRPVQQIAVLWSNVQSGIAGAERIFSLLDEPVDIQNRLNAKPMPPIQGAVVYDDVRAEYESGQPVLRGVTLRAEPGEMVAIVGPTGAGKTTLINLLPRFYDATGGSVQIDGIDVRDVTLESLRAQIGIVLQDTFLFSTSVMDNIRYARPDATDEQVIEAARLVAADDFIQRLPDGYNTVLGERGGGLSQGQRQLIAIARVALADPRILILDEATSSVDTRTERVIQAAFEKLLAGRTSFVIAHRLSTIRNADQVLMLRAGEVIERGTHEELLARRGAYYDLYMSQFAEAEPA